MRVGVMLEGAMNCSYSGFSSRSQTSALPTYAPDQVVEPMIRHTKSSAMAAMKGAGSRRDRASMRVWTNCLFWAGVMGCSLRIEELDCYGLEHTPGQAWRSRLASRWLDHPQNHDRPAKAGRFQPRLTFRPAGPTP